MKKTAEEILDKYQSNREYPNYYHESKIIEAMEEYASQRTAELEAELVALSDHNSTLIEERDELKPKWIKGYKAAQPKWIKIESEADLPKQSGNVWFMLKSGIDFSGIYAADFKLFKSHNTIPFRANEVSHYALIIKPQPPKED